MTWNATSRAPLYATEEMLPCNLVKAICQYSQEMYDPVTLQPIPRLSFSLPNLNLDTRGRQPEVLQGTLVGPYSVLGDGGFTLAASGRPPRPVPASYSTACPSLREANSMP